eukprot:TRINITY_DN40306_c0_g1_i1.p1 TRINITY_DN40306_c0_g1~~TRINITY_DN40306_c0_g1_i1.p1  ORF type:complete len:149 (-),score=41.26 TRINITY_DN40306_c0_g1_i1:51-497(-)
MPPSGGKRGSGRGSQGGRGGGGMQAGGSASSEGRKAGAGRGIPDYKENTGGRLPEEQNGGSEAKFNAQEAFDWIAGRYQGVMEDYEKQKSKKEKGDIQSFSDLNSDRPAWGSGAKPVLPGKEDFLQQLQSALMQFRGRQGEEGKGGGS